MLIISITNHAGAANRFLIRTNQKPARSYDVHSESEAAAKAIEIAIRQGGDHIIHAPNKIKSLIEGGGVRGKF